MARPMARTKKRMWGFDDGEREILVGATAEIPELRAVVARAGTEARLIRIGERIDGFEVLGIERGTVRMASTDSTLLLSLPRLEQR